MAANTIISSIVTGGSSTHTTSSEEANAIRTDFGTAGVIGAITLNSGSGGTGSFCVNQNTGSNLAINILAGTAQFAVTPSSQNSQILRASAAADYTAYTINSNASGSTKYDWIYLSGNATNANSPSATADNVISIVTSRSSSNTTDNGSPPTYGLLLAIVTVANAVSAITNANITDKRYNASLGAQNGSLIVNQNGTGTNAIIQAAGVDANVALDLKGKGTGAVNMYVNGINQLGTWQSWTPTFTGLTVGAGTLTAYYNQIGKTVSFTMTFTLGSGSSVSGAILFSLPTTFNTSAYPIGGTIDNIIGSGFWRISTGAGTLFGSIDTSSSTNLCRLLYQSSLTALAATSSTTPGNWASGSILQLSGTYAAA